MVKGLAQAPSTATDPAPASHSAALPAQRSRDRKQPAATAASQRLRIAVLEPEHQTARTLAEAIRAITESSPQVCTTVDAALLLAESAGGDLAIVGLRFGPRALDVIAALRGSAWRRVLALTTATDIDDAAAALRAGATGVLVTRRGRGVGATLPSSLFELSDREVEVIVMVADGRSNKWIGQELNLSALTVKSHLARIGRKLGTGDRARIVQLALQAGIIH